MFGFPSNIFSTSSTSGYPIYKDIRGFILLKLDMYNKITEFFSSVSDNTCIHRIRISLNPVWQHQANQQRGSDDGRVPSRREIH